MGGVLVGGLGCRRRVRGGRTALVTEWQVRIWEGGTEASDVAGLEGRCERNGCGGGFGAWSYFWYISLIYEDEK